MATQSTDSAKTSEPSVPRRPRHRGHVRQSSAPMRPLSMQMSELERQWSSNHIFESFSTVEDNAAMSWTNGSALLASDNDLPITQNSSGPIPVGIVAAAQSVQQTEAENGIPSELHDEARITNWTRVFQLCKSRPRLAQYVDPDGWTALHHACSRRCDRINVMEELIRAYPEALLSREKKDRTPLHYAARFKAPFDAVQLLLDLYPTRGQQAVSLVDKSGRTPLWYAVRYDAPPGVREMLLSVDASMVLLNDKTGESPLSLVWDTWAEKMEGKRTLQAFLQQNAQDSKMENGNQMDKKLKKSWESANKLLQAAYPTAPFRILHITASIACHRSLFLVAKTLYPETARETNDLGQTALHLAASSPTTGESAKFITSSLLELYPEASQVADGKDGSLPLHAAAANPAKSRWNEDGVSDIYQAYPSGITVPDKCGRTPLHRAAASSKTMPVENSMASDSSLQPSGAEETSILMRLIQEYNGAANVTDAQNYLPMHYFIEHQTNWEEEAQTLFDANPGCVMARGGERRELPLHLAASNSSNNKAIVARLVELNPRAATQANKDGQLPLHVACETGKDWIDGGTDLIYQAYEEAIRTRETNERGWYPLQIASASPGTPPSLIFELADHFPEAAQEKDDKGRMALHLACGSGKSWSDGVRAVFQAYPMANFSEDNDRMLPFHRAALSFANAKDYVARKVRCVSQLQETESPQLDDEQQVEVLFELLRAHPIIIQ